MPDRNAESSPNADEMTYEQAIEALETIIEQIEEGTIGLEASIEAYRRGTALIRRCKAILERAEQEIQTLDAASGEQTVDEEGQA